MCLGYVEVGIEPLHATWPGSFLYSFPPHGPLPNSIVTATQGPLRITPRGPKKQPSPHRRELSSPCQDSPRKACRTRQAGRFCYPLLSEEMLRTRQATTQLASGQTGT